MNNELYHYGVKGMRWGIRKKKDKKSDPNDFDPEHGSWEDFLEWRLKVERPKFDISSSKWKEEYNGWKRKQRHYYNTVNGVESVLSSKPNIQFTYQKKKTSIVIKEKITNIISNVKNKSANTISRLFGSTVNIGKSFIKKLFKK